MALETSIGVDVGGTKIASALVDLATGAILEREIEPTPVATGPAEVMARIAAAVARMRASPKLAGASPLGIGIGLPELVSNDGCVSSAWNLDWTGFDPERELAGLGRVKLESDVRAAALGEIRYGHGRQQPSMAYVTVGSGLSFAFCIDGRVHRGAAGFAIHFGSADLLPVCGACGAQTPFNLESFACGRGLADTYAARTGRGIDVVVTRRSVGSRSTGALAGGRSCRCARETGETVSSGCGSGAAGAGSAVAGGSVGAACAAGVAWVRGTGP